MQTGGDSFMLYLITFIALALVPLALGAYGAHLAAEVIDNSKHRKNAMLIVWGLALVGVTLAGAQQALVYKSDRQHETDQRQFEENADRKQMDLAKSLEYTRGQLDSISLMVGKVGEGDPNMKRLAESIAKMPLYRGERPHVVSVSSTRGNFQVPHHLDCAPREAVIQMTSRGLMQWQSPTRKYDRANLYLDASADDLTADVLVWCQSP